MKRILCATDFSEASDEALRQADAIARARGAALGVCHVVPNLQAVHPLFPQDNAGSALQAADLEGRAAAALAERVTTVTGRAKDEVTLHVAVGAGYAEIIRVAERWSAELVVVGSHGRSGLKRLLLGSVASDVLRYAHAPVLVARSTVGARCVLAATDLSDASLPAVEAAAVEAARRKLPLVVAHVLEVDYSASLAALGSPFGVSTYVPSADTLDMITTLAQAQIDAGLERFGAKAEVVILRGSPAAAIIEKAQELEAALVVVGTRGRTGIARVALGSVADKIAQGASSSVLAVRLGAESPPTV